VKPFSAAAIEAGEGYACCFPLSVTIPVGF
jgi:hypothetical protein